MENKNPIEEKDEDLITIKSFAKKISVNVRKAREIARSAELCDRGIAVNINPDNKAGGMRIVWLEYLKYIRTRPAVPECKRVRSGTRVI